MKKKLNKRKEKSKEEKNKIKNIWWPNQTKDRWVRLKAGPNSLRYRCKPDTTLFESDLSLASKSNPIAFSLIVKPNSTTFSIENRKDNASQQDYDITELSGAWYCSFMESTFLWYHSTIRCLILLTYVHQYHWPAWLKLY